MPSTEQPPAASVDLSRACLGVPVPRHALPIPPPAMPYPHDMSTRGSARADGARNRQAILAAAASTMVQNPEASVNEIAKQAGLTRATVYRHYPDRDELIKAVAAQTAAKIIPALLDEMRLRSWPDALGLLAERTVSMSVKHREVILRMAPRLEEAGRLAVAGDPFQTEIAARRAAGEVHSPLPDEWLAHCIRALCIATISQVTDPDTDPAEVTAHLTRSLQDVAG